MGPMIQNMEVMIQMVIIASFLPFYEFKMLIFTFCLLWWFSAENNPLNDYPDEISEEEEEELDGEASENESEEESGSDSSTESEHLEFRGLLEDEELFYEDDYDDRAVGFGED